MVEDMAGGNAGCGRSAGVGVGSARMHRETATAGSAAQAVKQHFVGILTLSHIYRQKSQIIYTQ